MSLTFGEFELDRERRQLRRSGDAVPLEPKAYELLCLLVDRRPRALSRAQIRDVIWPGTFVSESTLGVVVNSVREALGDDARQPRFIRTVHGFGYAFCGEAREDAPQEQLPRVPAVPDQAPPPALARRWRSVALLLTVLAATAIASYWLLRQPSPPRIRQVVQITNDGQPKGWWRDEGTLVTDGARVYYVAESLAGSVLSQVSTTGGETARLSTRLVPFPRLADISPDGAELLLVDFKAGEIDAFLWVLPLPAGPARRLGNLIGHDGSWSPDGKRVVYAHGKRLLLADKDGGASRPLVDLAGTAWFPRWSPDGTRLRFTVTDERYTTSLWEVSVSGTGLRPLLPGWNDPASECCGNWTPDGRYFVFESTRGGMTNVWALPERRGFFPTAAPEPIRLTPSAMELSAPTPSRDGRKLFVLGTKRRGELVRYDTKAGQFVRYLKGVSAFVEFSRDGQWVAYTDVVDGSLWRSRVDGSDKLLLAPASMQGYMPRWSPDGRRIAFFGRLKTGLWKIFVVEAEGGLPEQVMEGGRNEADPGWSPDGNLLVFCRLPWQEPGGPASIALHMVDLTTREISTVPGSQGLYSPRWSPDGRHISAMDHASERLMLFDRTTQMWTELARADVGSASWSRDGKHLYFNTAGKDPAFVRVRVSDRKMETLASLAEIRYLTVWSGLAPDDSPLLVRDVGTQEIYALEWEVP